MEKLLKLIVAGLPLLFAFGFLVPVIMQIMQASQINAPFGLTTLTFALITGGGYGVIAQIRGRWL